MDREENLIFIGSLGVGKSHLATNIGVAVYEQSIR
ncbi:ATP-binding protein [Enterococcus malodoratus]